MQFQCINSIKWQKTLIIFHASNVEIQDGNDVGDKVKIASEISNRGGHDLEKCLKHGKDMHLNK